MNETTPTRFKADLPRTTFAVLLISALLAACFWILQPFLPALIWSSMIVVSTWPLMLSVERRLKGRRGRTVAVMTLALVLLFLVPFALAVGTLVTHAGDMIEWTTSLANSTIPPPPAWVEKLPLIGHSLAEGWRDLAAAGQEGLRSRIAPYATQLVGWFASKAGHIGLMMLHFVLVIVLSAVLYAKGEKAADSLKAFARRLAGENGVNSVILAGQAVRAVAMGVIVTAAIQTAFAWLGMVVAGVPGAILLTALCFLLAVLQIGTGPVLLGVTAWLYATGHPAWGTAMLVWTVFVTSIDNVIRPFLIKRGANLPLLLIFAGVIGGLIAFGIIGLFVGPVVLAVSYKLLSAWVNDSREPAAPGA